MKVEVVKAEVDHIAVIAENVREADRQEMHDYALMTPLQALYRSYGISKMAWTGLIDDKPVVMFGVVPASLLTHTGLVWLIGTKDIEKNPMIFLKRCRQMLAQIIMCFDRLENYVSAENTKAIAWLEWLGFEFGEPKPMGHFQKPFIKFWMECK